MVIERGTFIVVHPFQEVSFQSKLANELNFPENNLKQGKLRNLKSLGEIHFDLNLC